MLGLTLLTIFTFVDPLPSAISWLWPLEWFSLVIFRTHIGLLVVWLAAIVAHLCEGMYAYILCRRGYRDDITTTKWVIQTCILGYPSLILLMKQKQP